MQAKRRLSRRAFIGSGALAGGAAILAACAPATAPAPAEGAEVAATTAPPAEAKIEGSIVVWNFPFTEDDDKNLYDPLNAKFAEEQPGIKVEVETLPWDGRREKLMTAFAAGAPPDVWLSSSDTLPRWIDSGVVLALDDCLGQDVLDDYTSDVLAIGQWEGKTYMVPVYTSGYGRLYNRTMMEEMGRDPDQPIVTWEEVREFAPKAKEKDWYFSSWNTLNWGGFLVLVWQAGGTVYSADRTKVQLTSEPVTEAMQLLTDLFVNGYVPEEGAVGTEEEGARARTDYFLTGQQVQSDNTDPIYMDTVRDQAPDVVWSMNPPWEYKRPAINFFSGNWSIPSNCKQVPAACEWIKFMVRAENLGFWNSAAKKIPPTAPSREHWVVDDQTKQFVDLASPALMANQDSNSFWQESKVTCAPHFQAAFLGHKSAEQALEDAQAELQAIVDEIIAKRES